MQLDLGRELCVPRRSKSSRRHGSYPLPKKLRCSELTAVLLGAVRLRRSTSSVDADAVMFDVGGRVQDNGRLARRRLLRAEASTGRRRAAAGPCRGRRPAAATSLRRPAVVERQAAVHRVVAVAVVVRVVAGTASRRAAALGDQPA